MLKHSYFGHSQGHKKAVSYVKFLNTHEIISAGTDGTLKLWDVNKPPFCLRSFVGGHVNEKNFVGLATNGDYIACGSEDNSLCIYYKVSWVHGRCGKYFLCIRKFSWHTKK